MKITPIKISLLILLASLFLSNCDSGTGPEDGYKNVEYKFQRLTIPTLYGPARGYRFSYHLKVEGETQEQRQQFINDFNTYSLINVHSDKYRKSAAVRFNEFDYLPTFIGDFKKDGYSHIEGKYFVNFSWDKDKFGDLPLVGDSSIFGHIRTVSLNFRLSQAAIEVNFSGMKFETLDSLERIKFIHSHNIDSLFPNELTFYHYTASSRRKY